MTNIIEELQAILGFHSVLTGTALHDRATSYWDSSPTRALALVKPKDTIELSEVMATCHARGQAVIVHGGLTGCVEGAVAAPHEIIVSLERMNQIEGIDSAGGTATVQAGVILQNLQAAVAKQALLFPLDLGARGSCTIGGNIATNAGGINVLAYGMMRSLVLGLEVVMANGRVLSSMSQMLKNNAGYDLKQLFIGSEGTLGIVTRAVLRLFPLPESSNTALVACADFESVTRLLNRLQRELAGGLCAFEVMWGEYYAAVTGEGGHRPPIGRGYPFYVVVESQGADRDYDDLRFNRTLENSFDESLIIDAVICQSESERRKVWEIRENFEQILPAHLYDVSLPISAMNDYVRKVEAEVNQRWPNGELYVLGHIADGNLHLFVRPNEMENFHVQSDEIVYAPLPRFGGSVSAEHGIGTEKRAWLGHTRSSEEIAIMRLLKQTLDPEDILNPGRVL